MGNSLSPCFNHPNSNSSVKVIFLDGTTKFLTGKRVAGELMFQFPDQIICHADSFYIGHPIPALCIDDELINGETYFVLPIDPFANQILSTKFLSSLSPCPKGSFISSSDHPFLYSKGTDGRMLIKVSPKYIMRIISGGGEQGCNITDENSLCSTPELRKHYKMLVGSKELLWSPKLETISEHKNPRMSPCGLLGF